MDPESIAKREKNAQRKIVVQAAAVAEETARCEAEQSKWRKNRNLCSCTSTSSERASSHTADYPPQRVSGRG